MIPYAIPSSARAIMLINKSIQPKFALKHLHIHESLLSIDVTFRDSRHLADPIILSQRISFRTPVVCSAVVFLRIPVVVHSVVLLA